MPTLVTGAVGQVFDLYSGDSVDLTVDFQPALDLTGLTLWWGMGDVVKSSVDPTQIELGETVVIHLVPDDTVEMEGGNRHQLRTVDDAGRVTTLAVGIARITASVFQPPGPEVAPVHRLVFVPTAAAA